MLLLLVVLLSDSIYWCSLRFVFVKSNLHHCCYFVYFVNIVFDHFKWPEGILRFIFFCVVVGIDFTFTVLYTDRLSYDILRGVHKGFENFIFVLLKITCHGLQLQFWIPSSSSIRWSDLRSISTWTVKYWAY